MSVSAPIKQSISDLAGVAAVFEAGQSRRPLYDNVVGLSACLDNEPLAAVLINFQQGFFDAFVQQLIVDFPTDIKTGELIINCGENSVAVDDETRTFPDRDGLLEQLRQYTRAGSLYETDTVAVDGVAGIAPTRFLIGDSQLLLKPDLCEFNRLVNAADLLVLSAPVDYALSPSERAVMMLLIRRLSYLAVLALPPVGIASADKPWHREAIPVRVKALGAVNLANASLPDYLADEASPLRSQLKAATLSRRLFRSTNLVAARIAENIHLLECRQDADDLALSLLENDPEMTAAIDSNRTALESLNGQLEKLGVRIQENSRHSVAGKGVFYHMTETELETLRPQDIEREMVHNVYKLSISQGVLVGISSRLAGRLGGRFEDDAIETRMELEKLIADASDSMQNWSRALADSIESIKGISGTNDKAEDHLDFKIRYRGEMPKRGFLKRIGEGRRAMFMVLMMFSIFGGMLGFNYRDYALISVFFIILFVGATIWTFFSWRRDDEFKMAGEVEKARDQLHTEYLRAIGEIERDRIRAINDGINGLIRFNKQAFDSWHKKTLEGNRKRVDEARDQDKRKKAMLKTELSEKTALQATAEQIRQRNEDLEATLNEIDKQYHFD
jgi:hypothetical protein